MLGLGDAMVFQGLIIELARLSWRRVHSIGHDEPRAGIKREGRRHNPERA